MTSFNDKLAQHICQNQFSILLKAIVLPGKIPASCAEHADRGAVESGSYEIKPSADLEQFFVTCDFRNCCRKQTKTKIRKFVSTNFIFANVKTVPQMLLPSSTTTTAGMEIRQYQAKRTAATAQDVTKKK